MIGVKVSKYVTSVLIVIDLVAALNSDGFCTFEESYTELVTKTRTYMNTIPYTRKCGVFKIRVCYDYRNHIESHTIAEHVKRTRLSKKCCDGYVSLNDKCIPVCSTKCINAKCTFPNTCTCDPGYEPPSLETQMENFTCNPKCNGCNNGSCTGPNQCSCYEGYKYNEAWKTCDPICSTPCFNANCTEPEVCTCFEGYELINGSNYFCSPVCANDCLNGKCSEPDVCLCNLGFMFNETSKQCTPICDEECVNSECTLPNVCTCQVGLVKVNATHCKVPCENCTNGYCEVANVCQCDIDFHMNHDGKCIQNECTPNLIKDSCENGYCADDGICMCNSGYAKNTSMVCAPTCSSECINGFCSDPDVCQCYDGYELSTSNGSNDSYNCTNCTIPTNWNVCDPICNDCFYGKCKMPGICYCSDGYTQHPKDSGKCILVTYVKENSSPSFLWIIITLAVIGAVLCIIAVFAYRRYVRKIDYDVNLDVYIYKDGNSDNEL